MCIRDRFKVEDTLTLATADPQAIPVFDEAHRLTGCKLRIVLCRRDDILKGLFDAYQTAISATPCSKRRPATSN